MTAVTMRHDLTALAMLAMLGAAGCGRPAPSGESAGAETTVQLFGAASTATALDEIAVAFCDAEDVQVSINCAGSSTLARQIENGAGADVFLSANESWVDYLEDRGLVAQRRNLLGNRLVVVVPSHSEVRIARLEDLLGEAVDRLALADPDAVPAGIYAKEALTKLGLWEQLRQKVVSGADVRRALLFVETGNAQAGIVYSTDAAISDSVEVAVEIDPGLCRPIRYPLALLAAASEKSAAVALFQYLGSPKAAEVFEKYGFTPLAPAKTR